MIYTVDYIADTGCKAQFEVAAASIEEAWGIVDENYGHLDVVSVSLVEGFESDDENGNEVDFKEAVKRVLTKRAEERLARFKDMAYNNIDYWLGRNKDAELYPTAGYENPGRDW